MSYPKTVTKTLKEFEHLSPDSVDAVVSILAKYGGKVKVLAGGTDLVPLMKARALTPEYVVTIKNISELDYIQEDKDGVLRIGALVRISNVRESTLIKQRFLSIYEATKDFATPAVRNMATVGGNICRSSPSGDMAPPLMTLDAELKLIGPKGERSLLLDTFFTGPGQNVLENEILTEIVIPQQEKPYGTAFTKLTRSSQDLAKINCAVKIVVRDNTCDDIRIAFGAVADRPVRAKKAEQIIRGKKISDEVIAEAAQTVIEDIVPITDVRSTVEYRKYASKVLARRTIKQAIERSK